MRLIIIGFLVLLHGFANASNIDEPNGGEICEAYVTPGRGPGLHDSSKALQKALNVGGIVILKGIYTISKPIYIRANTTLIAHKEKPASIKTQNHNAIIRVTGSQVTVKNIDFDFDNGGQFVVKGSKEKYLKNLVFDNVKFMNNKKTSGAFLNFVEDVKIINCTANDNKRKGIYIDNFKNVSVLGGNYHSNKQFGVFVAHGNNAKLIKIDASNNGSNGTYSGIAGLLVKGLVSKNNHTYDNKEHGESYQAVTNFTIAEFKTEGNGASGLALQSDMRPKSEACMNGIIRDGHSANNGRNGIVFKEVNKSIMVINNKILGNIRGIRLVDIAQSELISTDIYFKRNIFEGNSHDFVVNSNGSILMGD